MKKTFVMMSTMVLLFTVAGISKDMSADLEKSEIHWTAKKVTGQHDGNVSLKSGHLKFKGEKVVGGEFVVDMNSISNNDIGNETMKEKLLNHLRSDDFFSVSTYAESRLTITKVNDYAMNKADVSAELTIKGQTHPVQFTVEKVDDYYRSRIAVDRSRYDVRYGSSSFFDNLGNKTIEDIFTLDIKLHLK